MLSKKAVGSTVTLEWDRGRAAVTSPAIAVIHVRNYGHFTTEAAGPLFKEFEPFLVFSKGTNIFLDWFEMSGYDSEARLSCTKWATDHRDAIAQFHVLVHSKLVAMGVAVANVAVGGRITTYTDRKVFDQQIRTYTLRSQQGSESSTLGR